MVKKLRKDAMNIAATGILLGAGASAGAGASMGTISSKLPVMSNLAAYGAVMRKTKQIKKGLK